MSSFLTSAAKNILNIWGITKVLKIIQMYLICEEDKNQDNKNFKYQK